jgi:hypothetical protein
VGDVGPAAGLLPGYPAAGEVPALDEPYGVELVPEVGGCWGWLPLLRKRAATIPIAKAPLAKTIGCRRAKPSRSVRI